MILNQHTLTRHLIGAWLMDERGGNTAYDSSPYKHNATVTNTVSRGAGKKGLYTDYTAGTTSYLNCGNHSALNPTVQFTLFAYIYPLTLNSENWVLCRDDAALGRSFAFGVNSLGTAHLQINGANVLTIGTPVVTTNAWHSIAVVLHNNNYTTYVNGVYVINASGATPATTTGNTSIGARTYSGSESGINGYVAVAYIYNIPLPQQAILQLTTDPYLIVQRDVPTYLTTGVTLSTVQLSWTDNSGGSQSFSIERSNTSAYTGFTEITTVAAGVTSYDDVNLVDDTYYYRLRGVIDSSYTEYTNVVEITVTS